ncbi:unnamed protein product [Phyllotreta striolata]|uniref:Uncharacterized protein n=1 Tax=Phyllotreta striolata TaxID=444603 RepID=A0A9N9TNQ9_PHYSR|nr:unnamed protein product [Phyllotreta striolata]
MISLINGLRRLRQASRACRTNALRAAIGCAPVRCIPVVMLMPSGRRQATPLNGGASISTVITNVDVEENIGELLNLVKLAIDKGELDKAETILEMGIKICEEYQSYYAMPYMYDIMASIALATGKIGKAENILVRVIEKMVQLGIPEDNSQMVDFKLRLSRIYSLYQENVLAEIGFGTCLKEQETKINNGDMSMKTSLLYVNCLFFYGLHKISVSQYKRAKTFIDSAYSYAMKMKGLSPYQEMLILATLADLNAQLKDYDIALQYVNSAIILGKGIGSIDLPKLYIKLAKIYANMDSPSMARHWLREAAALANLFNNKKVCDEAEALLQTLSL